MHLLATFAQDSNVMRILDVRQPGQALLELRGHTELPTLPLRDDVTGLPGRNMQQEYAAWVQSVETDPLALIST